MILITGVAGYLGSHCAMIFKNAGHDVVGIDNFETGSKETVSALKKICDINFVEGDLKEACDIENVFEKFDITAVVHFAGLKSIQESMISPSKYYISNIFATLNLLETMLKFNVKLLVHSSSCHIYGEPLYYPLDEIHPQIPQNTYGRTKMIAEKILNDYDAAYGLKSVKLRHFNNFTGYNSQLFEEETKIASHSQNFEKSILKTLQKEDCENISDVEDIANAYFLAFNYIQREQISDFFNIGVKNSSATSGQNFLSKLFDKNHKEITTHNKKFEIENVQINSQKALKLLGWQPLKTNENTLNEIFGMQATLQKLAMHK